MLGEFQTMMDIFGKQVQSLEIVVFKKEDELKDEMEGKRET